MTSGYSLDAQEEAGHQDPAVDELSPRLTRYQ